MVIETEAVIGWFKLQLWMWLIHENQNYECNLLIELSYNKLSDNNLSKWTNGKCEFFKPFTIEEIVIFMIKTDILSIIA